MDLVKPGQYLAKVLDHGITETKNGDPQATVRFSFETPEGQRELTWYGSFKEKALEYTLKALVNCGLRGSNPANALEVGKEVSITVEIDRDMHGKDRNVIRWINSPGGIVKKMDAQEAAAKLERFSGAVMALKQKEGVKNHAPNSGDKDPWES